MGGKGWKGEIVILARCKFTWLENMKIWCKIQVIMYPLSKDMDGDTWAFKPHPNYIKVTGCLGVCVSVAKDFANCWTYVILLYSEAYHISRQWKSFTFLFKTKIKSRVFTQVLLKASRGVAASHKLSSFIGSFKSLHCKAY